MGRLPLVDCGGCPTQGCTMGNCHKAIKSAKTYFVVPERLWREILENLEAPFEEQPCLSKSVKAIQSVQFPDLVTTDRLYEGTRNKTFGEFAEALSDHYGIEK